VGAEYPHLAASVFFCMAAAQRAGLPVAEFHMAENGGQFVMKRFDVAAEGVALGLVRMAMWEFRNWRGRRP